MFGQIPWMLSGAASTHHHDLVKEKCNCSAWGFVTVKNFCLIQEIKFISNVYCPLFPDHWRERRVCLKGNALVIVLEQERDCLWVHTLLFWTSFFPHSNQGMLNGCWGTTWTNKSCCLLGFMTSQQHISNPPKCATPKTGLYYHATVAPNLAPPLPPSISS